MNKIYIEKINYSNNKNKRFTSIMSNGSRVHYGLKGAKTYIDHHDKQKRENYILRHINNTNEQKYILNLDPLSPSVHSLFLLWGKYDNIDQNKKYMRCGKRV